MNWLPTKNFSSFLLLNPSRLTSKMDQKLLAALFVSAVLVGLCKGRDIDLVFRNAEGKEIKLGDLELRESQEEESEEPGCCPENPGETCQTIKQNGYDRGDGLYWINAGGPTSFQAYCDMTSFGGGWTMCYSTNDKVKPKEEITYDPNAPYPSNGYRTDCNNIPLHEIMFVDEKTNQKAYFERESAGSIKAADNYDKSASTYGLWQSKSLAPTNLKYQLLICDTAFYSGFMVSGYTASCWKTCTNWCGDKISSYFRSSTTDVNYPGTAFNENGHFPNKPPNDLFGVGFR